MHDPSRRDSSPSPYPNRWPTDIDIPGTLQLQIQLAIGRDTTKPTRLIVSQIGLLMKPMQIQQRLDDITAIVTILAAFRG